MIYHENTQPACITVGTTAVPNYDATELLSSVWPLLKVTFHS